MKPALLLVVLLGTAFGSLAAAFGQDRPAALPVVPDERRAQIERWLSEILIDTTDLPVKERTLEEFLAVLEARLPAEKKLTLRIDKEGLGKQAAKVASTPLMMQPLKGATLQITIRLALSKVDEVAVDWGLDQTGVIVTRPERTAYRQVYDIRDIVPHLPQLLADPNLRDFFRRDDDDRRPADASRVIVQLISDQMEVRAWESLEVLNEARLIAVTSPTQHQSVSELLEMLRRLADLAVVMNARLYQVDRAFYAQHIVPLLARRKNTDEEAMLVRIDGVMLKRILGQKLLLESEAIKSPPNLVTRFLSRQQLIRSTPGQSISMGDDVRLAGMSFEVRPQVSRDRRFLRLHITQNTVQAIGTDKARVIDLASGKDVEVESTRLRKVSVRGTIRLPDGDPFLMPVDYRPPGKSDEDKVWLLVARPVIWIEAEEKERRELRPNAAPISIWETDVPTETIRSPAVRLPDNDKVKQILQAVIRDVITNPNLKSTRKFYGTPEDRTIALIDGEKLGWPKGFQPKTYGMELVTEPPDPFVRQRRVLGIRLDKFNLDQKHAGLGNAPIEVCLFNAGGNANGGVIGGCTVSYLLKRKGKRWTVSCLEINDP